MSGAAVDGKTSAGIIVQRVGDRVGRGIGITGLGGNADRVANVGVLGDVVGQVTVGDGRDVELIDIVQGDGERAGLDCRRLLVARTVMSSDGGSASRSIAPRPR